ncbi:MAG: hypothetical protein HUU37_04490 [Bdellovibrionales bacterium]|nr:hypothetical protein [Bdellovibrionales bacterium]
MQPDLSIDRQLRRERNFRPPFCPHVACPQHRHPSPGFCHRDGWASLSRFPYQSQRFRCRTCRRSFSWSRFSLEYRQKIWGLNETIFRDFNVGISKRELARRVGHSEHLVRLRLRKMARWGLREQAARMEKLKILEPIVYDGLENFSRSQYDPNNLNHAVGKESLFTYDFNLCPLNRKGRMSPRQRRRKAALDEKYGAYPRDAIRAATRKILRRLLRKTPGQLHLFSDRHYQYDDVVREDLPPGRVHHVKVSSKIARNFVNPLFAVNNVDMQARHNLAPFRRETIAFSKNTVAMQEAFALYMIRRNYMRPKFWGTHRSDPECSKRSPAMEVGVAKKIETFKEFFSH